MVAESFLEYRGDQVIDRHVVIGEDNRRALVQIPLEEVLRHDVAEAVVLVMFEISRFSHAIRAFVRAWLGSDPVARGCRFSAAKRKREPRPARAETATK
jgi:hypothetical protein